MKIVLLLITALTLSAAAFADHHENKEIEGHDSEHQQVSKDANHVHDKKHHGKHKAMHKAKAMKKKHRAMHKAKAMKKKHKNKKKNLEE